MTENAPPIAVATFLALAPPTLPMFPPLGAPQPGGVGVASGGGSLPSAALAIVRTNSHHSYRFLITIIR